MPIDANFCAFSMEPMNSNRLSQIVNDFNDFSPEIDIF